MSEQIDPVSLPARSKRIVIIGAGIGGICMGIALKKGGYDRFTILERQDRAGGVWVSNRYPGAGCDTKSQVYSYSFELNPNWSRTWGKQPEIQQYLEDCADKYEVTPHIRLKTEVTAAHWDDECALWRVVTGSGEVLTADILISAIGLFSDPKLADINGLDRFQGECQHPARWDPATTVKGKRVAVIGTGASSIQIVPTIAPEVRQLHVFQRSAPWTIPKDDIVMTDEHKRWLADHPIEMRIQRLETFNEYERFCDFADQTQSAEWENDARARIRQLVWDPNLQEKLTPCYQWGFSRPLFTDDYLPTFNRENVELVTDRIAEITETAIVTDDGKAREVDMIILATGFNCTHFLSVIPVTGRDGLPIKQAWKDGAQAYLGITTHGFPNLFMIYGPNTNNGSIITMIESQVSYIRKHLDWMEEAGITWMEVKAEVERDYNEKLQEVIAGIPAWNCGGNNYWRAESGKIVTQYPHSMSHFRSELMKPDFEAFETGFGGTCLN